MAFDFAHPGDYRVIASARALRLFETLRVGPGVVEFQRVAGGEVFEQLVPAPAVERNRQALFDGKAVMISALGADVEVALDFLAKNYLPATWALDPNIVGGGGLRLRRGCPLDRSPIRHRSASRRSARLPARRPHRILHRTHQLAHRRRESRP